MSKKVDGRRSCDSTLPWTRPLVLFANAGSDGLVGERILLWPIQKVRVGGGERLQEVGGVERNERDGGGKGWLKVEGGDELDDVRSFLDGRAGEQFGQNRDHSE